MSIRSLAAAVLATGLLVGAGAALAPDAQAATAAQHYGNPHHGHHDRRDRWRDDRWEDDRWDDDWWDDRRYGSRHGYNDWRYHQRYHDHYASRRFVYHDQVCQPNGDAVVAGALIGALAGAAAYDDGGAALAGGLLGAGLGAAVSDCDRGQYHVATYSAFSYDQPYYWHNPYSGVRGVVHAREWERGGRHQCRWGDAEIFLPNGRVVYDRVRMCRDRYGRWEVARRQ